MNSSFQIGNLQLPHRLIQAPLAGISCAPFRALFSLYTKPAYAVTEMVSAYSILHHNALHARYLTRDASEGLWCIQLSGNNPKLLYDAVQAAEQYKPDLIDLNCGCPMPKIRTKGCGSALLETPKKLEAIVSSMRKATARPLTVKIRLNQNADIPKMLEAAGADAITVHGRDYKAGYATSADYQKIHEIVNAVSIPVIANGDVSDKLSMERCIDETGADALMIGRGSIGNPWLFKQLLGEAHDPTDEERLLVFQQHITSLARLEQSEQSALFQARRLLKWYFPKLGKAELQACYQLDTLDALFQTVSLFTL